VETAGNHEMEDEPEQPGVPNVGWLAEPGSLGWQVAFDADGDALADAAKGADGAALDRCEGRVGGAQDEDTLQAHALKPLAENAGFEGGDIGRNVGEFRH
jgi:hypothetical protein